jgi:hypothetical protein
LLSATLLTGACGGDSDSGIEDASVPIKDVPKLYAGAACKAFGACFGPVFEIFLGGESCESSYETAISDELPRIEQSIAAGKVVYDGKKVKACIAAIEARGCSMEGEPPECTAALDGTVEVDGDCELNAECKGGDTYCKVGAACPGKCAKKELAGADCGSDDDCAAGLQCSKATQKCFVPAAESAACEGGGSAPDCAPGFFCIGSDDDAKKPGACKTFADAFSGKSGDPCFFDGKPACTSDLRCIVESVDPVAGKIVTACGQPFASGAACKIAIPDGCPTGEYCKAEPDKFDGTCTARPKAGEPCGKMIDDDVCAADTRCENGTCRARQHLGGSCSEDDVCYSDNCSKGACVPGGGCS